MGNELALNGIRRESGESSGFPWFFRQFSNSGIYLFDIATKTRIPEQIKSAEDRRVVKTGL
jgi:hypothetical protein